MKDDAPIDERKQEQETPKSLLEELIREGARCLLQAAIEQEVTKYLQRFREEKDDTGHRMVMRNRRLPERMFVTGVAPLRIHQPRIRDKREGETFTSAILPRYLRRVPTIDTLLPVPYLKGISTGDMMPALEALLGLHMLFPMLFPHTPGLSATKIVRLKRVWETEYREWTKRDLSGKRYVYVWAYGIHFNVRLEDAERNRQCFFILIGALENGEIFLSCFHDSQPTESDAFVVRPAEIHSMEQSSGSAYDQVTIKGKFFGTKKGKVYLEYKEGGSPISKGCKVLRLSRDFARKRWPLSGQPPNEPFLTSPFGIFSLTKAGKGGLRGISMGLKSPLAPLC